MNAPLPVTYPARTACDGCGAAPWAKQVDFHGCRLRFDRASHQRGYCWECFDALPQSLHLVATGDEDVFATASRCEECERERAEEAERDFAADLGTWGRS